jgi:hypothetical protein
MARTARLAGVALGRYAFAALLGVALAVSAGFLAYASFGTALQVSGWLCALAGVAGLYARLARYNRNFGAAVAAATAFFTGAGMLYLSYYDWSEFPSAVAEPLAAKMAPQIRNAVEPAPFFPVSPVAYLSPRAQVVPQAPAVVAARPERRVAAAAPAPAPKNACAALAGAEALQCLRCGGKSGLFKVFCQEQARLEYCDARDETDPACPSPIPVSPPG